MKEATVTSVKDDNGITLLDVELNDGTNKFPVAYGKLSSDFILAPQEGDKVAIEQMDSGKYVALCVISRSEDENEEVQSGEMYFKIDENNSIHVKSTEEGYKFIMDMADNVEISSEKDIKLDATGNIILGEDGEPVARQDHTHDGEYSWTDEGGSGTFTTYLPNEEGSTLEIP